FILYYISTIILPTKSTIFPYTTLFRSTKNKPILYEHLEEFVDLFKHPEKRNATNKKVSDDCNDWTVKVSDIKDYDISAKNPNKIDRKSTRLNSSHVSISYAVFCLKKKK